MPEKEGDTIVFRRYSRLDTVPVPLQDGISPPGAPLSATDIKARVDFYGNFVTITNQVELTVEDRVKFLALYKSSLIDMEAYVMKEAA